MPEIAMVMTTRPNNFMNILDPLSVGPLSTAISFNFANAAPLTIGT